MNIIYKVLTVEALTKFKHLSHFTEIAEFSIILHKQQQKVKLISRNINRIFCGEHAIAKNIVVSKISS
jgi:hypothetical protein